MIEFNFLLNRNPPKDSRGEGWLGPKTKMQLRKRCGEYFEEVEAYTRLEDLDILLGSPEWIEFVGQAQHDFLIFWLAMVASLIILLRDTTNY
jgi:hypothetical protein